MTKYLYYMLVWVLAGLAATVNAAQTCRSQSEIPASTPTANFSDHADGTLTDTQTGLMWAKCALGLSDNECTTGSAGSYTWQAALGLANTSTLAGHTNWRLPNINELRSIVEEQCYAPSINLSVFPNTPASIFWSASPITSISSNAWGVHFSYGHSDDDGTRDDNLHVRLVRSGQ